LFLFALAGIPLTSGFAGKFAIFRAALSDGAAALVIVGVISSAIAAFAYLRIIVVMFFCEPGPQTPDARPTSRWSALAVAAAATATVVLGVAPQPVLDLANQAGHFLP
jgi:NADH-quinone oxidoreductase subunit N